MKIVPDEKFMAELAEIGRKDLVKGFEVDGNKYQHLLHESRRSHPHYTEQQRHAWAAYSAATLPESPKAPFFKETLFLWSWRVAMFLTLLGIAIFRRC